METSKVDMFLLNKGNMFPNAQLPLIREMLTKANENVWVNLNVAFFYNPTTALIMSLSVGSYGIDRFYLGQPLLGIGKLLLTLMLIAWVIVIEITETENLAFIIGGSFVIFILSFWYLTDIFLVPKIAREQNLKLLLTILN